MAPMSERSGHIDPRLHAWPTRRRGCWSAGRARQAAGGRGLRRDRHQL